MFNTTQGNLIIDAKTGKYDAIVITTNLQCRKDGTAVMGAGIAKAAAINFPGIDKRYGDFLRGGRKGLFACMSDQAPLTDIVCFPTKDDWKKPSILSLIEQGLQELVALTNEQEWQRVGLPPLGCGLGGLSYQRQVKPLLERYLDERFWVCFLD